MDGLYAHEEFKVELIVSVQGRRTIGYVDKMQQFLEDYFTSLKVVSKDLSLVVIDREVTDMEDLS